MITTTITNIETYNKVAILRDRAILGKIQYYHYTVESMRSAEYNAEFEIPEDYHITEEFEISGLQYTRYASDYGSGDRTAVKTVNPNYGIEVSFYEPDGGQTDILFEIKK